jgi:hypothetical protein
MKIEITNGCMAYDFEIDGKSIHDCTINELKDALTKANSYAVNKANDESVCDLQTAIRNLVELFGDCECDGIPCECCGDFVETYTLELNPIPITEEWLTKQGFKREYDCICEYTYYIREIDGYFVEVKIGCSNMGDDCVNCHIDNCDRNSVASADIQYVHQLQNLTNIMNIKFDIKL